jgi:SAM-dependent methyltransferase
MLEAMERAANLKHWEEWAQSYGTELRATTKCVSIKRLEIEALLRAMREQGINQAPLVLEVGCGNGANGFALAEREPDLLYLGLDYSPTMVENALAVQHRRTAEGRTELAARLAFGVADARALTTPLTIDTSAPHGAGAAVAARLPAASVDVVFTDRMLINLASPEEQLVVMRRIARLVRPGGLFLMIENSAQSYATLNRLRSHFRLPPREPASYNVFIDEEKVIDQFTDLKLVSVDNFSALHDLALYVLEPALGDGTVKYDSPLTTAVTDAVLALSEVGCQTFGAFGQNRLWVWRR